MSQITDSILLSVKKMLGLDPDYTAFDPDIILFINSTLGTLHQLGVGPEEQFSISDNTATWDELLTNDEPFNEIQEYVYLKVRCVFDPPSTSFVLSALQERAKELEWRLTVKTDEFKELQ